jgi:signal transduction histidine kinase
LVDAETGERGFIITGDDKYLDPYNRARDAVAANFSATRGLTADNRDQEADLDQLATLSNRKLDELAHTIVVRRKSGFTAAQARVADDVGRRLMESMRTIAARMEAREDRLLAVRSAQAAQSYRSAQLTRLVGVGVGLAAVIGLFLVVVRYGADRVVAMRALEAKQAELLDALQQKDEFVAVVSHELRTPINSIAGWASMLEQHMVKPERIEAALTAIRRNAESLRQLVADLLDTSQLAAGRLRLIVGPVDLNQVVQEALDAVRLSADNKGVVLTAAIAQDRPLTMQGDAGRLKQVVWNLLANAIKFTPAGGHVTIALTATDSGFRLEVSDTGAGIDPGFLPYVFERFRQGKTAPRREGVGLGLAIVRHLVELHGGTVTAHSAGVGKGSTFVIELPLVVAPRAIAGSAWSATA